MSYIKYEGINALTLALTSIEIVSAAALTLLKIPFERPQGTRPFKTFSRSSNWYDTFPDVT
jgi:hypothetical protein